MILRVLGDEYYVPTALPVYADPDNNLAVCAVVTVPLDGEADDIALVIPYAAFPADAGGAVRIEVAVHDPDGPLQALDRYEVGLPDDLRRTPDLITVMAHTLVSLCLTAGRLDAAELQVIRAQMQQGFELDDVGADALTEIFHTATQMQHTPESLAEVLARVMPEDPNFEGRFVDLLYDSALADGELSRSEQTFIDELLERLALHDHKRRGPEGLDASYEVLGLEAGANLVEVKKAYKSMLRDYHPDRVAKLAQGFQDYANERTQAIVTAYRALSSFLEPRE